MKKYRAHFQLTSGSRASFSQEFEYDPKDTTHEEFEQDMYNYAHRLGADYLYSDESRYDD